MITVIHVVNQFFAGLGGEDKAGLPVAVGDGAVGAARGRHPETQLTRLPTVLGDRPQVGVPARRKPIRG